MLFVGVGSLGGARDVRVQGCRIRGLRLTLEVRPTSRQCAAREKENEDAKILGCERL